MPASASNVSQLLIGIFHDHWKSQMSFVKQGRMKGMKRGIWLFDRDAVHLATADLHPIRNSLNLDKGFRFCGLRDLSRDL